jgi:hypothetical protein
MEMAVTVLSHATALLVQLEHFHHWVTLPIQMNAADVMIQVRSFWVVHPVTTPRKDHRLTFQMGLLLDCQLQFRLLHSGLLDGLS